MKTIVIDYATLKKTFFPVFNDANQLGTEVYYKVVDDGWIILFHKNNFYVKCHITKLDLLEEAQQQTFSNDILEEQEDSIFGKETGEYPYTLTPKDRSELLEGKIASFEVAFLKKAIKVVDFEDVNE